MSFVGRLLGTESPHVPEGAQLIICEKQVPGPLGMKWEYWVAYVRPGEDPNDVANQHKCSETFDYVASASAWREFMLDPKGHPFTYPTGAV